jgi:uncharacterized repeat protein (TIGR03803 family)
MKITDKAGESNTSQVSTTTHLSGGLTEQRNPSSGATPTAGLIMDASGNLYGTTHGGGANGYGTVFELVNSSGTYSENVLHSFTSFPGDGAYHVAGLELGSALRLPQQLNLGPFVKRNSYGRGIPMSKKAVLFAFVFLAALTQAFAASDIVYVSYNGVDTNPCSRPSPCKTITHALTVVNAGGQVSIVGSGTYAGFTITHAVTVSAEPGVVATVDVPANGDGVTISAGATDRVVIQGLTLNGHGSGMGITVNSAGEVSVENCESTDFFHALNFVPSAAASLTVKGGVYEAGNTSIFICCAAGGTAANAVIDKVTIKDGDYAGVNVDATLASVTNSSLSGPGGTSTSAGILAIHGTAVIENNVISNYFYGVEVIATGNAAAYLSANTISGNSYGVLAGGTTYTRGDNTIEGNSTANVAGTVTSFSGQ